MSKYGIVLIIVTVIVTGCSLLVTRDDERGNGSAHSVTPFVPAPTFTPSFVPAIPTPTMAPTEVLPLSGPHDGMRRSISLAYFHIAPEDGEPAEHLADRASFVTLTHGDEDYREELRAAGYDGTVLQFLVASEVNGPGPYADASARCDASFQPLRNGIARDAGEFCADIHPNEDWFLHNGKGERLYDRVGETGVWYHMNPANPEWVAYAVERIAADMVGPAALGFDGVLLDNVELSMEKVAHQLVNSDGAVQEFADDASYREAWISYLEQVSGAVRSEAELWANMAADPNDGSNWAPYLSHVDGAMFPAFATGYRGLSVERWDNNLRQAEATLNMGKKLVTVGIGTQSDHQRQTFAAASYLLVASEGMAHFRYVNNETRDALSSFWLFPNYDLTLGEPLGERYRVGQTWRRDFQCGYVIADPGNATGEIVQTECGT